MARTRLTPKARELIVGYLLAGRSWHYAVAMVTGESPGVKLRVAVYRARCDVELRTMLEAKSFASQPVDREALLRDLDEAAEMARDVADHRGLIATVESKAGLLGLKQAGGPDDDFAKKWTMMTETERAAYIQRGMEHLRELHSKLGMPTTVDHPALEASEDGASVKD
jgi:hypothetical protein